MTNAVSSSSSLSSSSLSSFSRISSTSSTSSANISTTKKADDHNMEKISKLYQKLIGIEGLETEVESFACAETCLTKNLFENKSYKKALKKTYAETLEVFKKNIGINAYFNIAANAISDLKRVVPNAPVNISANKSLLTKRIFCNLFKKIKLMDGDGFLRSLFPGEDILSASKVIDYSINSDVLEKMHKWIEDKNLITMMKSVARQNAEVSQNLNQTLLSDIDSASLDAVHTRAQSFRAWINGNNNVLLNVTELNLDRLGLTSLPKEIDKFINLQDLFLFKNHLTQLPDSIGNLGHLEFLLLDKNRLIRLPDFIGNLGNLQWLSLSFTQLTSLPNTLGNLRNLQKLYLDHNRLTSLPYTFGNLRRLQQLNLCNNHITRLPDMTNLSENVRKEIFKNSSLKAQISYYLELLTFCSHC